MSANLLQSRCFHHPEREAVARCPSCARFYCRECITEHEGRVICADCLRMVLADTEERGSGWLQHMLRAGAGLLGFFLLWLIFFSLGRLLLDLPSSFHEGTIWKRAWQNIQE